MSVKHLTILNNLPYLAAYKIRGFMFNTITFVCAWLRAFRPNSYSTAIDFSLCPTHDNQLRFHNVTTKNGKIFLGRILGREKNVGSEMIYMPSNTVIASNIKHRVLQGERQRKWLQ